MLGETDTDRLVKNVMDTARGLFPEQTAQAEQWVNATLTQYGISYAKYQAEQKLALAQPWLESPIVWFVGAFILIKLIR